jgi:hypothetical protein
MGLIGIFLFLIGILCSVFVGLGLVACFFEAKPETQVKFVVAGAFILTPLGLYLMQKYPPPSQQPLQVEAR